MYIPLFSLGVLSSESVCKGRGEVSLDPRDPWPVGGGVWAGGELGETLRGGHLRGGGEHTGGEGGTLTERREVNSRHRSTL